MGQRKVTKKETASVDAYLRTHAKKPLQRIFTKLETDNKLGLTMSVKNGDNTEPIIQSDMGLEMFVPTVVPGATFTISDIRNEDSIGGVTPYEFAIAAQYGYEKLMKSNLETILNSMDNVNIVGIEDALKDYKNQIQHITSHNREIISGIFSITMSKFNISAVIEIFNRIYKAYPDKKDVIGKALCYVLNDNDLFKLLIVERDNIGGRRRYIAYNPQIDPHLNIHDVLYNNGIDEQKDDVDQFMNKVEAKIALSTAEATTILYDTVFKILSKIELSTHGCADLGYQWIMDCLDNIAFDVFAEYHDSLIDMLRFTVIKLNALLYNYGTFRELEMEINGILDDVFRTYERYDDEYYE